MGRLESLPGGIGDPSMTRVVLQVIPRSDVGERKIYERTAAMSRSSAPLLIGEGDMELCCGRCSFRLAQFMGPDDLGDYVFKCPSCAAFCDPRVKV